MTFRNGLPMASIDTYLHVMVVGLWTMLAIVLALIDAGKTKRALSKLFLVMLGFMLTHFATHLLPNTLAEFIYSSHHEYHLVKSSGVPRT